MEANYLKNKRISLREYYGIRFSYADNVSTDHEKLVAKNFFLTLHYSKTKPWSLTSSLLFSSSIYLLKNCMPNEVWGPAKILPWSASRQLTFFEELCGFILIVCFIHLLSILPFVLELIYL